MLELKHMMGGEGGRTQGVSPELPMTEGGGEAGEVQRMSARAWR